LNEQVQKPKPKPKIRPLIIITLAIVVIVGIFISWDKINYFYGSIKVGKVDDKTAEKEIEKNFASKTPEGEMRDYENMSEYRLLQEVHGMTHQKVYAAEKWGSSEITKDKIEKLYAVVQKRQFQDKEIQNILLGILKRWSKGDFSKAVSEHNEIWNYLDGNIGKATRLLTPQEELIYVERHFR
jgi:hypothetical protein